MTLKEYQKQAQRTCPSLGSVELDVLHMQLGVFTELGEIADILKKNFVYKKPIDTIHIGEEVADTFWYVSNLHRLEGSLYDEETKFLFDVQFTSINKIIEDLIDYNHQVYDVSTLIYSIALFFEVDIYDCLDKNIAKLRQRYPEKFTTESALNRDLYVERKILEG